MWGLFKWVVIPCLLGFVGYSLVGPTFVARAPAAVREKVDEAIGAKAAEPATAEPAPQPDIKSTRFKAPTDVEIVVSNRRSSGPGRAKDVSVVEGPRDEGNLDEPAAAADAEQPAPERPKRKKSKKTPPPEDPSPETGGAIPDDGGSGGAAGVDPGQ